MHTRTAVRPKPAVSDASTAQSEPILAADPLPDALQDPLTDSAPVQMEEEEEELQMAEEEEELQMAEEEEELQMAEEEEELQMAEEEEELQMAEEEEELQMAEEEEELQMAEEEEELQMKGDGGTVQMAEEEEELQMAEEEEELQMAEEEEELQMAEEEEELQMAEEEEELQMAEEEEELQMKQDPLQADAGTVSKPVLANAGLAGASGTLPHSATIQESFGGHDISGISAAVGGNAAKAGKKMGAKAFAKGKRIGFKKTPDLHLAAHEAAHTVQQEAGISIAGGVGTKGDAHEQHADAVADAVVAGKSAEPLLDEYGVSHKRDH